MKIRTLLLGVILLPCFCLAQNSIQKNDLTGSWMESPDESNLEVIIFRPQETMSQMATDPALVYSRLVFNSNNEVTFTDWKYCSELISSAAGTYSIKKNNDSTILQLTVNESCSKEFEVVALSRNELKLKVN